MMKLMTVAAAVALLLALATPTSATFAKDVARHRQRRGAYCDAVKHSMTCSQKGAGSACTSDANCAIDDKTGKCTVNPNKWMASMDLGKMMATALSDAFTCGLSGAKDEAACEAVDGTDCVWKAGDDGKMGCTGDEAKMLNSVTDPDMKKMMTMDFKCKAIKGTDACMKDSDCSVEGTQCKGDGGKLVMGCLTSGAGAGNVPGTVAKGCAKMVDMLADCAAKTAKDACTGDCEWKDDEKFCEPHGSKSMSFIMADADGQAFWKKMNTPGILPECEKMNAEQGGTCKKQEATCSACTAKSDMCELKLDGQDSSALTLTQAYQPAYKCDDNIGKVLRKVGCGSQVSRVYKIEAQRNRAALGQLEIKGAAAKKKVEEAETKLAACTDCADKAALETEVAAAKVEVAAIAAASTKATADAATADKEADANSAGGLASAAATVLAGFAAALLSL
jgi:hypothetical protein